MNEQETSAVTGAADSVILVLVGLNTFTRRDLKLASGVVAVIRKDENFRVSAALGDALTSGDYCNYTDDSDPIPHFEVVTDAGAKIAYDFTLPKVVVEKADRQPATIEKSAEGLDGVTVDELKNKATAKAVARTSQRSRARN